MIMRSWVVDPPGPIRRVEKDVPEPAAGEVLVKVLACGVCRTDLHLADGELPPRRPPRATQPDRTAQPDDQTTPATQPDRTAQPDHQTTRATQDDRATRPDHRTTPGHEVVGEVITNGRRYQPGDRVGIAWLRGTCGTCRWCRPINAATTRENLCPQSTYTGWDADGGYAEYATVPEDYAYPLPKDRDPVELAPLLCAGIIGFRALRRSGAGPGSRLGIWGFGASAHITVQIAWAAGVTTHVFTRSPAAQALARELGAATAQGTHDRAPEPLDAAIIFAPAGDLVPTALQALDRGGVLAIAGIHLTDVPTLNYQRHLFQERELRSVAANTRADGVEFLDLAARIRPRLAITRYRLEDADVALADLAADRVTGVAVLDLT